jgi:cytochrome c oxidase assembly protein subunit 15
MKNFIRFSFISTLFTYLVIFTGGLVRVSGAGLGCPDWPHCFGRWLPPLSYTQLPEGIDPLQVNLVLAWIEYLNRILGVILGILVVITAILAIKNFRKVPSVLWTSIAAALMVALLGWQGGKVVQTHLEPLLVSMHFLIALLLASLLVYASLKAFYHVHPDEYIGENYPRGSLGFAFFLWILTLIQAGLGTQMRAGLEIAAGWYPLASDQELIASLGAIKYIHPLFGAVLALLVFIFALRTLASSKPAPLMRQGLWLSMLLVLLQLAIGLALYVIGTPPFLQVFHLWIAALLVGTLLMICTVLIRRRELGTAGNV